MIDAPPPSGGPPAASAAPAGPAAWLARRLGLGREGELIGRNSGWMLGERAFRLLVGLAVNAWMVRYLGADRLGLLGFAQSVVVIAAVAAQFGLENLLVRELVREPDAADELMGTAFALRVCGWLATAALSLAAAAALRPHDGLALALTLVCATTVLWQSLDVVEFWFQSRTRVTPVVRARFAAFLAGAAARVVAIELRAPLVAIAAVLAGEFLLSSLALLVSYRLEGGRPSRWRASAARARALLADAWPLVLNSLAICVSVRADQMVLTALRGPAENGLYAAVQRLTEVIYYVPVAVMATANAVLLQSHGRDAAEYARRLQRVLSALAAAALAIAVVVSLAAPLVVRVLYGPEFRASAPVLAILVWAAPVLFMGIAQVNWFVAHGRMRGLLLRSAVAAAGSVALNLALVPPLGARGAAIALLVSQSFAYWLLNGLLPSTRPLFRMQCRALVAFGRR